MVHNPRTEHLPHRICLHFIKDKSDYEGKTFWANCFACHVTALGQLGYRWIRMRSSVHVNTWSWFKLIMLNHFFVAAIREIALQMLSRLLNLVAAILGVSVSEVLLFCLSPHCSCILHCPFWLLTNNTVTAPSASHHCPISLIYSYSLSIFFLFGNIQTECSALAPAHLSHFLSFWSLLSWDSKH